MLESRYSNAKKKLDENPDVIRVYAAEQFLPPHKSAAFAPYDMVLLLTSRINTVSELQTVFETYDVEHDKIISVVPNDMYYDCANIAYVSLETFNEYAERGNFSKLS